MSVSKNNCRCLILSCSQSKDIASSDLPAIKRYTGPSFKVLSKFLREEPNEANHPDVYILSAQYGLISSSEKISSYDQKMTSARARSLQKRVLATFHQEILSKNYSEIFLSMGKTYLLTFNGLFETGHVDTCIIVSRCSSGKKLTELRNWLWKIDPADIQPKKASETPISPNSHKQAAVLRGKSIEVTTIEAIHLLQGAIAASDDTAFRIRNWYVDIDGERISPKWAANKLFNVPVNKFSADEARRVLKRLGLCCYQL